VLVASNKSVGCQEMAHVYTYEKKKRKENCEELAFDKIKRLFPFNFTFFCVNE